MKDKTYRTVRTLPQSNIKIVETGKIDTSNTQIHDSSLFLLGAGTSVKCGGVKLVLWSKNLSE